MPVEIKELKIKAVIVSPYQTQKKLSAETIKPAQIESLKREIKRECMEAVKQFLNEQKER